MWGVCPQGFRARTASATSRQHRLPAGAAGSMARQSATGGMNEIGNPQVGRRARQRHQAIGPSGGQARPVAMRIPAANATAGRSARNPSLHAEARQGRQSVQFHRMPIAAAPAFRIPMLHHLISRQPTEFASPPHPSEGKAGPRAAKILCPGRSLCQDLVSNIAVFCGNPASSGLSGRNSVP